MNTTTLGGLRALLLRGGTGRQRATDGVDRIADVAVQPARDGGQHAAHAPHVLAVFADLHRLLLRQRLGLRIAQHRAVGPSLGVQVGEVVHAVAAAQGDGRADRAGRRGAGVPP